MDQPTYIQQGDANDSTLRLQYQNVFDSTTKEVLEEDARYFLHQALSTPVMNVLQRAEGPYIYDLQGRKYLDLHGNGVHNIGYNNPCVVEAIKHQLDSGLSFSPRRFTNRVAIDFAKKMVELAPEGLSRALFCPGGAEAIEMAVLLAKQITGKWKTISFWDNYHGTTWQAASVGGTEHFSTGYGPMVPGAFHVEFPNYYRNPWGLSDKTLIDDLYLRQIEIVVQRNPDIAAIIGATITSTPVVPSAYYWQRVQDICQRHDAFLIFDEIICGLGRAGTIFACEQYITPDVVVLGKSLGGGIVPLAGIITKEHYNSLSDKSIGHFTHEKSPLTCAAGLATLQYIEIHNLAKHADEMGRYLLHKLFSLQDQFPVIGHIEGKGLLIAVDLVTDRHTKERAFHQAQAIMYHCLENGLSFKLIDGNVLALSPALTIGREEADFIIDVLENALRHTSP